MQGQKAIKLIMCIEMIMQNSYLEGVCVLPALTNYLKNCYFENILLASLVANQLLKFIKTFPIFCVRVEAF